MRLRVTLPSLAAAIGVYAPLASALGQQPIISFTEVPGALQIAGGSASQPQILVSSNEYWGVIRAAGDLAKDFGRVTGTNFTLSNGEAGAESAVYTYSPVAANYTHVSILHPMLRRDRWWPLTESCLVCREWHRVFSRA